MKKLVVLFSVAIFLVSGCSIKKEAEVTDAEKFAIEYSISTDNPFKYVSIDEVLNIFSEGTGIVFFANSDCEICMESAKILSEVVKRENIDDIYYYNPKKIQEDNTEEYQELINILDGYLESSEEDLDYLFLPDVYFVKDGKIIGHNNDLARLDGAIDEVLTTKRKKEIRNDYLKLINDYNNLECTTC